MINLDTIKQLRSEKIGYFRFKKLDAETYIITSDSGKFSLLDRDAFREFISSEITEGHPKFFELLSKGFIKHESYIPHIASEFGTRNQFLNYGPLLHIIIVTLRCNHKCKYCHAAAAPEDATIYDMSIDTARATVDTILCSPASDLTIEFQGGEPLLNWKVVKFIIKYAQMRSKELKKNIRFALVTNLSLMDEEKLAFLLDNNVGVSTSLDGTEAIHNYNRTYSKGNSYDKVTYWIRKINEEHKIRGKNHKIGALLTVTKKTLSLTPKEVVDSYVSLGLDVIFLRVLNPYGFAAIEREALGYTNEEFFTFFQEALLYIIELNKNGIPFQESHSKIYLSKILTPHDPNYLDARSPCGACIGQVAYNYNGKVYSCDEGRMFSRMGDEIFHMTDVTNDPESTFKNMGSSPTTKAMVQMSTLDGLPGYNDSVYKPYIGVCPINSYKTNGTCIPNYAKDSKRKLDEKILDFLFTLLKDPINEKVFLSWLKGGSQEKEIISQCEVF